MSSLYSLAMPGKQVELDHQRGGVAVFQRQSSQKPQADYRLTNIDRRSGQDIENQADLLKALP